MTAAMSRAGRAGKVFIDWSQNDRNKTTACVFSVRARPEPSVLWPLDWAALETKSLSPAGLATSLPNERQAASLLTVSQRVQTLPSMA